MDIIAASVKSEAVYWEIVMKLLNLCALVGVVVGCSSTTVVQSHPADAAVEDTSVADTAPPPPAGVEGCTGGQTVVHNYPPGPYGFGVGQTLADFCLQGYLAPDKQTLEPLALHDYFDWAGASGNTVLFLSAGMTWCGPCNAEAAQLPKASTDMAGKGAVIFQVLLDGPTYGVGSTEQDLKAWDSKYMLPFHEAMDTSRITVDYFPTPHPPGLIIDTKTMKVLKPLHGLETATQLTTLLTNCVADATNCK